MECCEVRRRSEWNVELLRAAVLGLKKELSSEACYLQNFLQVRNDSLAMGPQPPRTYGANGLESVLTAARPLRRLC